MVLSTVIIPHDCRLLVWGSFWIIAIRPGEVRYIEDPQTIRPWFNRGNARRVAGLYTSDYQHLFVAYELAGMVGPSHLVAGCRFEPAKSRNGQGVHIEIVCIIGVCLIIRSICGTPQDESIIFIERSSVRGSELRTYISKVAWTEVAATEQKN